AAQLDPERLGEHAGLLVDGVLRAARNLDEAVAYVTKQARESARVFRATTSKFAELMAWLVSGVAWGLAALTLYVIVVLFWKLHYAWACHVLGSDIGVAARLTPEATSWWWVAVLGGLLLCLRSTARVARRLRVRVSRTGSHNSDRGDLF